MKSLLRLLLKSQHQRNRSHPTQTEKGMTLVELLVGAIMAFLIITPMLAFVVDMLNTDRKEQVKANTEQDIQAAVDFIGQDLSQAIYIYDRAGINEINKVPNTLPPSPANTTGTPILVFWKRQQIKNAVPINSAVDAKKPSDCPDDGSECNDTYVLSLVAYYQIKDTTPNPIWCEPSGGTCPTRIARYEIRDGVKNPISPPSDPANPYYSLDESSEYPPDKAFDPSFDISKPTLNVTKRADFKDGEVLVNYIDHSPGPTLSTTECENALGNPTDTTVVPPKPIPETTLKIANPDNTNSFYACVDTAKNTARVTIRGNSLRRIQPNDAAYDDKKSAFFPTASIQVQGLGARGK
ncbi:hypothetical protein IQ269_24390 [Tychonema sp. LEGE 07199]|uniref:hormogonium polysaccharide secretion pseudopilin HpsC n=1 Tax=unclassified Tychonema TaxID=2642144 RepID=UPI001880EC7E|nr:MULTISPECIES: hormogonium polysaccharide secretion pseudopilin HpsC [unclassified Tychonema]MBE9123851.1 hypothetical protein [Tychonema sp. LEGE 07199]MBE9131933.1 hypothetical protein [Tychonema sp. LEGE 07196]